MLERLLKQFRIESVENNKDITTVLLMSPWHEVPQNTYDVTNLDLHIVFIR